MTRLFRLAPLFCLLVTGTAMADHFYMTVFGVQDRINSFTQAHTFASFVRTDGNDPASSRIVESRVISWLPANGIVRMFVPPEPGRNYPLAQSLDEPAADGRRIAKWGPYEIRAELFERAKARESLLERGALLYQAVDGTARKQGRATNCEHAVSDIDTDNGLLHTGAAHGNRGSHMVARHLRRWLVSGTVHKWVATRMGLDQYPITDKKL